MMFEITDILLILAGVTLAVMLAVLFALHFLNATNDCNGDCLQGRKCKCNFAERRNHE